MSFFKYLYKQTFIDISDLVNYKNWNYFISAYNNAERVQVIYNAINADMKKWFVFREYNYGRNEVLDNCHFCETQDEASAIIAAWQSFGGVSNSVSVCIDATGFIRPYLAFLILYFKKIGFEKIDIIYSEPMYYTERENTKFSAGKITDVRQLRGFEGTHNNDTTNDILVINSGYDSYLISCIAEHKKHAKKLQLIGFPSLRPDMYQQCILQIHKAQESLGRKTVDENLDILAPANDPFITADNLKNKIENLHSAKPITNLYLSPLATKAQLLGVVLYYLLGSPPCPTSIIFPFTSEYSRETTRGFSRAWLYTIEF